MRHQSFGRARGKVQSRCASVLALLLVPCALCAMNVVRPFKFFFNPPPHYGTHWQIFVMPEHGFSASGFTGESCRTNVLQTWNSDFDALAMLKGLCCTTPESQRLAATSARDNGVRGNFDACGHLCVEEGFTLAVRRALPHNIMLGIFLPAYSVVFDHVRWVDLTRHVVAADERVHTYVTDGLACNVHDLGGLNIGPWRHTGLGDAAIVGDWLQDFVQARQLLKNVRLDGRFGLTLPTGRKENVHVLAAFPFGYNGSMAFIFGGGLELTLGPYLKAGFDVELRNIFGNSRRVRIKTDPQQTEPLLLHEACVYTDYAIEQQYTLYGQLCGVATGFLLKCGYQFFKQGDTTIVVDGNAFSTAVASRVAWLRERNVHKVVTMATYDFSALTRKYLRAIPSLSLYAEVPFGGKRMVASPFVGAVLGIDF